jgi:asparagine synthase (glutamine-hydrolysing)
MRAFAGTFDPRRRDGREAGSLAPDGVAETWSDGPLSLAWTGGAGVHLAEASLCILDGTVYNLPVLAAELGRPAADPAEVLAAAYVRWGSAFLPRLRGDFALFAWDAVARRGLLARDQLGGRPLFVWSDGTRLTFASEVRNLIRLLPATPGPDLLALSHWLVPAPPPGDRTLFEGVRSLAPGSLIELAHGRYSERRYWAPSYRRPRRCSTEEATDRVRAALTEAVRRRAASAEESGVLLSGGIDSASVAGVAAATLAEDERPRRSYSAVFPQHPAIDESKLIRAVASSAGLRPTALGVERGSVLGGALDYLEAWRLPPSSPNLFFLRPLLERAAADGTRVMLDGEGGDAVFWFAPALLTDRLRRGRLLSAWSLAGRFPEYGVETTWRARRDRIRQFRRDRGGGIPDPPSWLGKRAVEALAEAPPPDHPRDAPRWWSVLSDGILGPGSRLLHDVSRRHAALAGLVPRHPLLDLDLVELALSLPPELAFDRRYNRPLLRHAVAGLVPDEARLRPYKSNFDPVFNASVAADLPAIEGLLLAPDAEVRAFVDAERLRTRLSNPPSDPGARRRWSLELWHLSTAECWLRLCTGNSALPAATAEALIPTDCDLVSL